MVNDVNGRTEIGWTKDQLSIWFLDLLQAALPQETSALPDDFALDCMLVTQLIACS